MFGELRGTDEPDENDEGLSMRVGVDDPVIEEVEQLRSGSGRIFRAT